MLNNKMRSHDTSYDGDGDDDDDDDDDDDGDGDDDVVVGGEDESGVDDGVESGYKVKDDEDDDDDWLHYEGGSEPWWIPQEYQVSIQLMNN